MKILAGISVLLLISLGTWGYINRDTILKETGLSKTETPIVGTTTTETLPNNNNTEESIDISVSTTSNTIDTYNWEKNLSNTVNKGKAELPTPILGGGETPKTEETKTTVSTTATKPKVSTPLKIVWDTIIGDKDKATTISSTPKSRILDLGGGSSPLFHAPILGGGGSGSAPSTPATPVVSRALNADCVGVSPDWMSKEGEAWDRVTVFPEDCIISGNNPPAFYWAAITTLPERVGGSGWYSSAEEYTFTLTYPTGEIHTYNTNRNYFSLPAMLPTGGPYAWTITASTTDTNHHVSVNRVSNPRHFYIASDADPLLIPSMDTLIGDITSKPRPWSRVSNSKWTQIMDTFAVGGSRRSRYLTFLSNASTTKAIPIPADDSVGSIPYATTIRGVASMNARYLEILMTAYDVSGDESYFNKLHDWVLAVTTWDYVSGNTSMSKNDLDTQMLTMMEAIIYDRYKDKFTIGEQVQLKTNIMNRLAIQFAWEAAPGDRNNLRYAPESHHTESSAKIVVSSLLMLGEDPLAETYVRELFPLFVNILHPFGGEDGGHNQGGAYSDWDMSLYSQQLPFIKNITGVDLSQKTGFKNFGYFKIYTSPAGQAWSVFGDAHNSNIGPSASILTHDQMSGKSPASVFPWGYLGVLYHDLYPTNAVYNWYRSTLGAVDDFNYPSRLVAPINTADSFTPGISFPTSALFPSVGTVGMHSSLTDLMRTSVYFRSSPQGSYSHAHADANTFVIFSRKMPLAIESGFYDIWGEDYSTTHHIFWDRQTVSKNGITYDNGIGQHSPCYSYGGNRMSSGKITQFEVSGNNTYTTGDASTAYRDPTNCNPDTAFVTLSKAIRSLVYFKDKDVVLVFDNLEASTSTHQWEWNIHSVDKMTINPDNSLVIDNEGIKLCVQVVGSNPLSLVQSNKFDPDQISASLLADAATDTNAFDPVLGGVTEFAQWHARYYTPSVYQTSFAAVLKINCDTNTTNVGLTQIDSHTWRAVVDGQTITFDGTQIVR